MCRSVLVGRHGTVAAPHVAKKTTIQTQMMTAWKLYYQIQQTATLQNNETVQAAKHHAAPARAVAPQTEALNRTHQMLIMITMTTTIPMMTMAMAMMQIKVVTMVPCLLRLQCHRTDIHARNRLAVVPLQCHQAVWPACPAANALKQCEIISVVLEAKLNPVQ